MTVVGDLGGAVVTGSRAEHALLRSAPGGGRTHQRRPEGSASTIAGRLGRRVVGVDIERAARADGEPVLAHAVRATAAIASAAPRCQRRLVFLAQLDRVFIAAQPSFESGRTGQPIRRATMRLADMATSRLTPRAGPGPGSTSGPRALIYGYAEHHRYRC